MPVDLVDGQVANAREGVGLQRPYPLVGMFPLTLRRFLGLVDGRGGDAERGDAFGLPALGNRV